MKLFLFLVFILSSCGHMRSGRYVKILNPGDFKKIAREFKVSEKELNNLNNGNTKVGNWIFVPLDEGFLNQNGGNLKYFSEFNQSFLWPVPAVKKISSKFGKRWGRAHEGIDIAAPLGTHFLASEEGKVIFAGNSLPSYGNMIIIDHGNGVHTVYAHAEKVFVRRGDRVFKGEVIGKVGSTGRSTGPHLHFEIRKQAKALNPEKFLVLN